MSKTPLNTIIIQMPIHILTGKDATEPIGDGCKIIAHVVNDRSMWGKGFVMAISAKWPQVKAEYQNWMKTEPPQLGEVQFVQVENNIIIANMICQSGIISKYNPNPFKLNYLPELLKSVKEFAHGHKASIHMPKIGAGLGGGDWDEIVKIIEQLLSDTETYIYEWD